MALLNTHFFSDALGMSTSMTVILPQRTTRQIGMTGVDAGDGGPPVLYLLHGLSDDDTVWLRRTSIERYVADLGLAVVMPRVERSFSLDEAHGLPYGEFLTDELPEVVSSFFRVSDRREDTFVAGLSMGGFGALRWALTQPDRFAAAASLSGALDLSTRGTADFAPDVLDRVFGGEIVPGGDADVVALLERSARAAQEGGSELPDLYVACGTDDDLLAGSKAFADRAAALEVPVTTQFGPGGHTWDVWDAGIQDVLAWLPLRPR
ncbi:alpha/beta hydrolase [Luteimicrobium subarcticum]|uniref:S-formylglutathione hydrolase FrmB n=1 Tax=Luteimicrobium subarcticum TaxID=620910 RepID=A0A2M8W6V0_9MICO|nr:alpha/beta hydrolase family protein [Luteimicrobium subarcticum]PJI86639.1 S-formylglutathione hydrolase FrmB [Luteimicrobium subarcticum]